MIRTLLLLCFIIFAQTGVAQSVVGAHEVCDPFITDLIGTEGCFNDFVSTAPSGYRVNIHIFGQDDGTYYSEYYFKTGSNSGFEETRWPWVLHYSEVTDQVEDTAHYYYPMPLVIGEQEVGYFTVVDTDDDGVEHDMQLGDPTVEYSDDFLAVIPSQTFLIHSPVFSSGSTFFTDLYTSRQCFTYTLDQFGSISRKTDGFHIRGFDGGDIHFGHTGVFNLISHSYLSLNGRFSRGRHGVAAISEAGLRIGDGHAFRLVADSRPALEVRRPDGTAAAIPLDGSLASCLHAYPLDMANRRQGEGGQGEAGDEALAGGLESRLFLSSFDTREAALQDPLLNRYHALGDLGELDEEHVAALARVTLSTWAFEVTLVVLEDTVQEATSLKVMSHRRIYGTATEAEATAVLAARGDCHGVLGLTAQAGERSVALEDLEIESGDVLDTDFAHSLFKPFNS